MVGPEMSVIHMALHPKIERKVNLDSLLIYNFLRQWAASTGDIRCRGLITQIAYASGIVLP